MEAGKTPGWMDASVAIDGVLIGPRQFCKWADEERGIAAMYVQDEKGNVDHSYGTNLLRLVRGKVTVILNYHTALSEAMRGK